VGGNPAQVIEGGMLGRKGPSKKLPRSLFLVLLALMGLALRTRGMDVIIILLRMES
jgi:hypothetical protein